MKAMLLALVPLWGMNWEGPDYSLLIPAVVEAAQQSMFEGGFEGTVAINLGSFVAEMNRKLPRSVRESDLTATLENKGQSFSERAEAVQCLEDTCRWSLAETLWIQMNELEITESVVSIEVRIQAKAHSPGGFVTNVIRYDFAWQAGAWVLVDERAKLRS